jgi:hypothetical protein|tara:strand:+ start:1949 stop:2209 length:261 start_codon:yes stop_codon:yes gene_type:complete
MFSDFDTQIQCEEFYGEELTLADLNGPDDDTVCDDEEDLLETQVDMPTITDDEDYIDTDDLFNTHGGLTADAYAILAEMDSAGEFI